MSMGRGGGAGLGDEQQPQAAQAMRDIESSLGFDCFISNGLQAQFMLVVDDGDLPRLKALVGNMNEDDKGSLSSVRIAGVGALHLAAMKGELDICKYLVEEMKFDVNSASNNDSGPLTFAASYGQIDVASYLLSKGADPNKQDHDGFAPLHEAARQGLDEITQLLLSSGAHVDISSPEGTPLHVAAAYGNTRVIQILLFYYADVNKVSVKLCTPIAETLLATPEILDQSTCVNCMKLLVKAGADLNSSCPETPLVIATIKGLRECVEYLLKAGANTNIPANAVQVDRCKNLQALEFSNTRQPAFLSLSSMVRKRPMEDKYIPPAKRPAILNARNPVPPVPCYNSLA